MEKELKEQGIKEQGIKEQSIKELSLNEQSIKEQSIKELSLNEQSLNEQSLNELSLNEQSIKELSLKEQGLKEQEPELKEREPELREPELREPELREPEIKEPELKEREQEQQQLKKRQLQERLKEYYRQLGISEQVWEFGEYIAAGLEERFREIDMIAEFNQLKVLKALQENQISEAHLLGTTGYGYNDLGRDALEKVYAAVFHTEDALVRPQITCGTHALALALMSNLRPGDELLSPVGKPYDTLAEVIGIRPSAGSLAEYGITYRQVDLLSDGGFDWAGIEAAIHSRTKLVTIQRSKGYQTRPTLSVERIGELIAFIRKIKPDVICMVDNCYGEFVETREPSDVGADLVVGSLIKNPGGGLAPIGGYIAGKKAYVEQAAYRLTSPGLGKEVGASLGILSAFYQGLFLAPTVTAGALKGAVFAANIYETLGFPVVPDGKETRYDIIQAVTFGSPEGVVAFCQGIQSAAPIDSHVTPEPWDMPGYDSPVIMAAGAFVSGSSIELSADGPIKEPYAVYFQGGLTWEHAKIGILKTLQKLIESRIITDDFSAFIK